MSSLVSFDQAIKYEVIMDSEDTQPRYVISVAAAMLGVQTHTLCYCEKIGIIEPSRSQGNIRLYSHRDVARLRRVKTLMGDLGVTTGETKAGRVLVWCFLW